ncbi:MAG: hypothetical protein IAF38_06405 [Bacteroidia bacterium]|nr:hypothetical protein [Bacteroidia bacterium]
MRDYIFFCSTVTLIFMTCACGGTSNKTQEKLQDTIFGVEDKMVEPPEEDSEETKQKDSKNLKIISQIKPELLLRELSGNVGPDSKLPLICFNKKNNKLIISSPDFFQTVKCDKPELALKYFRDLLKTHTDLEAEKKRNRKTFGSGKQKFVVMQMSDLFPEWKPEERALFSEEQIKALNATRGIDVMKEMTKNKVLILCGDNKLLQLYYKGEQREFEPPLMESAFSFYKKYFDELNSK